MRTLAEKRRVLIEKWCDCKSFKAPIISSKAVNLRTGKTLRFMRFIHLLVHGAFVSTYPSCSTYKSYLHWEPSHDWECRIGMRWQQKPLREFLWAKCTQRTHTFMGTPVMTLIHSRTHTLFVLRFIKLLEMSTSSCLVYVDYKTSLRCSRIFFGTIMLIVRRKENGTIICQKYSLNKTEPACSGPLNELQLEVPVCCFHSQSWWLLVVTKGPCILHKQ